MHLKLVDKYYFINTLDTNNLKNQNKQTTIIYRNYKSSRINENKLLKFKKFCQKRGNKFLLANNFKLALKLGLNGVYIPSFNNKFNHLSYKTYVNFIVVGSAHNLKEIRIKEKQKVSEIFLSSIFKGNRNYLGINKFKIISDYSEKKIVALGGVSKKNIHLIKLTKSIGFAGISFFE